MRRNGRSLPTSITLIVALVLHGAVIALAATESPSTRRNAVTASTPEDGSLGIPAQRAPDLARPARNPQPTFGNRTDRRVASIVVAQLPQRLEVAPPHARRARSNPMRLRVHPADDPPH